MQIKLYLKRIRIGSGLRLENAYHDYHIMNFGKNNLAQLKRVSKIQNLIIFTLHQRNFQTSTPRFNI